MTPITNTQFCQTIDILEELVSFPTVSDPNSSDHSMETMIKAANFVKEKLAEIDFDVRCVRIHESAPYVLAEKIVDKKKPTVLLYAHYDVQPVDRKHWKTDPFHLVERGGRLYGRGASDDKGGIAAILTALNVFHESEKGLPVNVKILFEGEEEYDSTHMEPLLKQEAKRLNAEVLVVLDGMNKSVSTGSLSTSTRGFMNVHVRVDALKQSIHSGLGSLAPDPAQALCGLIASLKDPTKIPHFMDDVSPLKEKEREELRKGSITSKTYAKEVGALHGKKTLRGDSSLSIYERIVETPSISVINMTSGLENGGNSIQASARCTLNIRVLPGQNPNKVGQAVVDFLKKQPVLFNLPTKIEKTEGSFAWKADITKPYSQMYLKALGKHFKKSCSVPCGGTLPLFNLFENAFPKMEMLLPGVEDPNTNAHSHNESQDGEVLRHSINSLITFLNMAGQKK